MGDAYVTEVCTVDFRNGTLGEAEASDKSIGDKYSTAGNKGKGVSRSQAGGETTSASNEAGRPALRYYYAAGGGKSKSKACLAVEKALFQGRDRKIGLAAKFFNCEQIDVTGVTSRDNKKINKKNAPLVEVLTADGTRVKLLKGKITGSSLLSAMVKALKAQGVSKAEIKKAEKLLAKIRTMKNESDNLSKGCDRKAEGMAKSGSSKKKKKALAKMRKKLEKGERKLAEAEKKLLEFLAKGESA